MKKFLMIIMAVFLLMPLSARASEMNDGDVGGGTNIPTCPTVASFSVSHDDQKNYTFTVEVEGNGFEVTGVGFGLKNNVSEIVPDLNFGMWDQGGGIYQLTFNFNDSYAPEYVLSYISINARDQYLNDVSWKYTEDGRKIDGIASQIWDEKNIDESMKPMKIDGVIITYEKPVLKEFGFKKDELYVPDNVDWNLKAQGVSSPIALIEVTFGDDEGTCITPDDLKYKYARDYAMEKAGSIIEDFGRLSGVGLQKDTVYYFETIRLVDVFGNEAIYSINAEDEEYRLEKRELRVINNRIYDVLLDLDDTEFLTKLENAEDNSVVMIDSCGNTQVPAEFF